jgi:hypothetical protein
MLETTESFSVDNAVPVSLEGGADGAGLFIVEPAL